MSPFYFSNLKKRIKKLSNIERVRVIIELSSAMEKVHQAGFIHRDLKLENILLDKDNHVKLSDFGFSTFIEKESESESRTQMVGTLNYIAPELVKGEKNYDQKVDVYAFGVVMFMDLMKGEKPNITSFEVATGKKAEIPKSISKFSKQLIEKCWSFKASERPSFEDINMMLKKNEDNII